MAARFFSSQGTPGTRVPEVRAYNYGQPPAAALPVAAPPPPPLPAAAGNVPTSASAAAGGALGTACHEPNRGGRKVVFQLGTSSGPLQLLSYGYPATVGYEHPHAVYDANVATRDAALAASQPDFAVRSLAHGVFPVYRSVELCFSLADLVGAGDRRPRLAAKLFTPHMFPTVGDILSVVDDDELAADKVATVVACADSPGKISKNTLAAALCALRKKHVYLAGDAARHNAVVIQGARITNFTSTFPVPFGINVTGVRAKVTGAGGGGCFAEVWTDAGPTTDGDCLDVERHAGRADDYASYVGVSPEAERAEALARADSQQKDRYHLTAALDLLLQHLVDENTGGGEDPAAVGAYHAAMAQKGVFYNPADPAAASQVSGAGLDVLVKELEARRARMPIRSACDVEIELEPDCAGGWAGAEAALAKSYAGYAGADVDLCAAQWTVRVGLQLDLSYPELAYALECMLTAKVAELRAGRQAAATEGKKA